MEKELPPVRGAEEEIAPVAVDDEEREAAAEAEMPPKARSLSTNGSTGAAHEMLVAADLTLRGHEVFRAVSPAAKCDLIVEQDGDLLRVEVRTAVERADGTLSPNTTERDCDLYAFVCGHRIEYFTPEEADAARRHPRGLTALRLNAENPSKLL